MNVNLRCFTFFLQKDNPGGVPEKKAAKVTQLKLQQTLPSTAP